MPGEIIQIILKLLVSRKPPGIVIVLISRVFCIPLTERLPVLPH